MATEQARQQPATNSSDIYSIGAVLYWMLTGVAPFQGENIIETIQAISKTEPVSPRGINSSIPRDLESICLRCLEKEPTNRYEDATELYRDLERFERGEPVLARAITPTIRLTRWVCRNPMVTTLLGLLLLGVITSTIGFIQARVAESNARLSSEAAIEAKEKAVEAQLLADSAKGEAEREEALANEVADYLVSVFKIPLNNPRKASEVTAIELLDRAASEIKDDLGNQPEVRLRLIQTMAEAFENMGQYPKSIELYQEAFIARRDLPDLKSEDQAKLHFDYGKVLRKNEQFDESSKQLDLARQIFEQNRGGQLVELAGIQNELALIARAKKDSATAIFHLQSARELTLANDPESKGVWQLDANIASTLYSMGKYEEALTSFQDSLKRGQVVLGESHQRLATLYANIGAIQRRLGRLRDSIDTSKKGLEISKQNLPNGHPALGQDFGALANSYRRTGQFDKSLEYGSKGLEILKGALPADHSVVKASQSNHSITLMLSRDYEAAFATVDELIGIETNPAAKLDYLVRLAQIESCQDKHDDAQQRLETLLEQDFSELPATSHTNVLVENAIVKATTEPDEAEQYIEEALEKCIEANTPPEKNAFFMARFRITLGDEAKCLEELEKAVSMHYRTPLLLKPEFDSLRENPRFQAVKRYMLDERL